MEIRQVALQGLDLSLARLRQLPQAAVREKTESLRRQGQLSPLVAAQQDGALVLVDGFLRYQAAKKLGLESMLVAVVQLSAAQMKAQLYLRNRERGLQLLEECQLVQELCDADGLSQIEVADLLERHKSWVSRRLALFRSLSHHLLTHDVLGGLPGGAIRRLAQLHARNQEQLMAVADRDGIGPQAIGALADLLRRAPDQTARSYVFDHPREALALARARPATTDDPRLTVAGRELLTLLSTSRQIGLRIVRRVREGLGTLPPDGVRLLDDALRAAEHDGAHAIAAVRASLTASHHQETS